MHAALANLSKNVNKSETSGEFFWKQLSEQRERKGQHQLIVTFRRIQKQDFQTAA